MSKKTSIYLTDTAVNMLAKRGNESVSGRIGRIVERYQELTRGSQGVSHLTDIEKQILYLHLTEIQKLSITKIANLHVSLLKSQWVNVSAGATLREKIENASLPALIATIEEMGY